MKKLILTLIVMMAPAVFANDVRLLDGQSVVVQCGTPQIQVRCRLAMQLVAPGRRNWHVYAGLERSTFTTFQDAAVSLLSLMNNRVCTNQAPTEACRIANHPGFTTYKVYIGSAEIHYVQTQSEGEIIVDQLRQLNQCR